jgi:hypothetical protein
VISEGIALSLILWRSGVSADTTALGWVVRWPLEAMCPPRQGGLRQRCDSQLPQACLRCYCLRSSPRSPTHLAADGKGIDHCRGNTFICRQGSVSASKRACQAAMCAVWLLGSDGEEMQPSVTGECLYRGGNYCTGPRGRSIHQIVCAPYTRSSLVGI